MRRSRTMRRIRIDDPREQREKMQDGEAMARFLLRLGYKSAITTAKKQYDKAVDKKTKQWWNNTRVWIGMLA